MVRQESPGNLLHVRVALRGFGCETGDRAGRGRCRVAVVAMLGCHRVPSLDLAHVADRGGGPCHPVTIRAAREWNLMGAETVVPYRRPRVQSILDRHANPGDFCSEA